MPGLPPLLVLMLVGLLCRTLPSAHASAVACQTAGCIVPANTYMDDGESVVWSLTHSPITVQGLLVIERGCTLTIQPGVEVLLASGESSFFLCFLYFDRGVACSLPVFSLCLLRSRGSCICRKTVCPPLLAPALCPLSAVHFFFFLLTKRGVLLAFEGKK